MTQRNYISDSGILQLIHEGSFNESFRNLVTAVIIVGTQILAIPIAAFFLFKALVFGLLGQSRVPKHPKTIVITGASSGIGEALAVAFASPGTCLALIAKDMHRLQSVAEKVREKGAECEVASIDIGQNGDQLETFLFDFDDRHVVDLVIANAGTTNYEGDSSNTLWQDSYGRTFSTNVLGTLRTVNPFLKRFAERKEGQIVFTSSINALVGIPNQLFYNSTKAAVLSLAQDLRFIMRPHNVFVSVILPGLINTRITEPMKTDPRGPSTLPNIMFASPKYVAEGYKAGILRGDFHIASPAPEYIQQYVARTLPSLLFDWYIALFGATGAGGKKIM